MKVVTFDKSAKNFILDSFNKTTDEEGYVIEKDNPTQRVLTSDGLEIKQEEFGGVKKGSEVYIKSDLISLIKLADDLENDTSSK